MIRKLFRAGNSLAVAVPGGAATALGLAEGDYVEVLHDAEAGALLVWPRARYAERGLTPEFVREVGAFAREYGAALAALEQA